MICGAGDGLRTYGGSDGTLRFTAPVGVSDLPVLGALRPIESKTSNALEACASFAVSNANRS